MFWWLAQNTLLAGVLALAAALAGRFGRLAPAVRHALWLVVLVKLIAPPVAFYSLPEGEPWSDWLAPPYEEASRADSLSSWKIAATTDPPPLESGDRAAEIAGAPSRLERNAFELGEPEPTAMPIELDQAVAQSFDDQPRHEPITNASAATAWPGLSFSSVRSALIGVWAIGAGCMVLLQAVRLWRFRRLLRSTAPAPRSLAAVVEVIAAQLGVSPPQIVLTSAACSPMVFAFGRPRLIWPNSLAAPLTGDARRAVIAHELAHLRRRDHWVGWLELVASCGWWWNPLFWYVRRQLRETAELACDAWVVSLLPGGRRAYAQALIDVSEMISWTAAPAVGMGASARHLFERRLTMILRERVPCRTPLVSLALIGLLGIAVLPGWTRGQAPVVESLEVGFSTAGEDASPAVEERIEVVAENREIRRDPNAERSAEIRDTSRTDRESARQTVTRPEPARNAEEVHMRVHAFGEAVQQRKLAEIKELESRLAALAEELRALRGAEEDVRRADREAGFRITAKAPKLATLPQLRGKERQLVISRFSAERQTPNIPGGDIETLTRAKYKLPSGRAEALAAFIKQHVKEDVETRIDGETLVVTATADDQARIGQFVQLLKKTPEVREQPEDAQGKSNDPFTPPIAVDSGFPLPVDEPIAPASAAPSSNRQAPLPASEESGPKGPLPPPPADAAPTGLN